MKNTRLQRQSFLGPQSDGALEQCRVAIVGIGGGGSHIAQQLAHLGVGHFVLCDPQNVEDTNLNRLVGATATDVIEATAKVTVAARVISGVNPTATVVEIRAPWQTEPEQLRDCDLIFGCVDSYRVREELERIARRFLTPYLDIGMDVHPFNGKFLITGQVALSLPSEPCMWCMGLLREELLAEEARQYGAAGEHPQVIWPNAILASTGVGLFVNLVTPWHSQKSLPLLIEYDGNEHTVNPSNKLTYLGGATCSHHEYGVGDPFWKLNSSGESANASTNHLH